MFNAGLKSPELGAAAAAAARRKSQAPDLRGEVGGGGRQLARGCGGGKADVLDPALRSSRFQQASLSSSYAWGPPSAPHPQVKPGCAGGLFQSRDMDLLLLPQPDPPSSQPPGSCMTHSQPLRFSQDERIPPSPAPSASPASSMHPPGFSDLVASLDGSIPHSSSWIPGWDLPGSRARDLRPSRVPAVGTRGAHGEELGSGREWTHCETLRARGSRDRPAQPCYPRKASLSRWNLVILGEPCDPGGTSLSRHSPLLFCTGASGGRGGT